MECIRLCLVPSRLEEKYEKKKKKERKKRRKEKVKKNKNIFKVNKLFSYGTSYSFHLF